MTGPRDDKTTHFGFREVPESAKAGLVGQVFSSVASRYDVMNDVMSFGIHRLWKRFTIGQAGVRTGQKVLDLAGGTGDLAAQFVTQVGPTGSVTVADINAAMLDVGRARFADRGLAGNVEFVQANAECLPFPGQSFRLHHHCLRPAQRHAHRRGAGLHVPRAKPGGRLLVLEFSKPVLPGLNAVYDAYSFHLLPKLGKLIANDEDSYRYLVESIRKHPDQETLKAMMEKAGFERAHYFNLSGGIVALHKGYKF